MKKTTYIKCPRCELNYILKKDTYCDICKQEMKAGSLEENEFDDLLEDEGLEICPMCKVNFLNEGESICASCQEEQLVFDKDEDANWRNFVDKSTDDDDLDLLPVEENEIDKELDSAFAKDLDDEFADDLEDEDLENDEDLDELDLDFDDEDFDEDDEDDDDEEDEDDDELEDDDLV